MAKASRTPLIAGNWKMNLNHAEAVHLVQKLALTLARNQRGIARTEVTLGKAHHRRDQLHDAVAPPG